MGTRDPTNAPTRAPTRDPTSALISVLISNPTRDPASDPTSDSTSYRTSAPDTSLEQMPSSSPVGTSSSIPSSVLPTPTRTDFDFNGNSTTTDLDLDENSTTFLPFPSSSPSPLRSMSPVLPSSNATDANANTLSSVLPLEEYAFSSGSLPPVLVSPVYSLFQLTSLLSWCVSI